MRALAAIALVSSLASGCVHGDTRYVAYAGEVALTTAGLLMLTQIDPHDAPAPEDPYGNHDLDFDTDGLRQGAIKLGGAMALMGLSSFLITYFTNDQLDAEAEAARPPLPDDLRPIAAMPGADPDAVRLTMQARHAAVAGLCGAVGQLAPKVEAADRSYFRAVFVADPAIASCGLR